jgi:hypothetical protein
MLALYYRGGRHHRRLIQRVGMVVNVPRHERRTDSTAIDTVLVGLCLRSMSRVKIRRRFFD